MPIELVRTALASPPISSGDAVAEANHRIANNLSMVAGLVRMHGRRITAAGESLDPEEIRLLLEEIGSRIDTVGRLHGLLARSKHGQSIDVTGYIRDLSEAVVGSLTFAARARLSCETSAPCLIGPARALPLGFIVVELITNAVKYAHPAGVTGAISVACSNDNDRITVAIADDGVGLPEGFDPMASGGLGFRLMRSLADQIGGKLSFTDSGVGLTAYVQMPIQ